MKNPEVLWRDLVFRFAAQSRCKSRQVGAIVVKDGFLISEGWNSAPAGSSTDECPRPKCKGDEQPSGVAMDQILCAHAEANAISGCARRGISTAGATLYCTTFPCAECAKLIVGAGILEVVYDVPYPSPLTTSIFDKAMITSRRFDVGSV